MTSSPQRQKLTQILVVIVICALLGLFTLYHYIQQIDRQFFDVNQDLTTVTANLVSQLHLTSNMTTRTTIPASNITILFYSPGTGPGPKQQSNYFHLQVARKQTFQHCSNYLDPAYQCQYSNSYKDYSKSDAVVFRGIKLHRRMLPRYKRPKDQWWIFWEHEPPYKVWKDTNLTPFNGLFNITATYSLDSDIPRNMHLKFCIRDHKKYEKLINLDFTAKKRKDVKVAWMVSKCPSQSRREEYVEELRKYIDVDIYGRCGTLKCGSKLTYSSDGCVAKLLHQNDSYKFYLAFENSFCEDYVTEKIWKTIGLDIVPVVLGAVDYANMLPKDSYIDARDFANPSKLADYLNYLDKHDNKYNEIIRNKNSLMCKTHPNWYMPWECQLCKYLHETKGRRKIVYNLDTFWGSHKCLQPQYVWKRLRQNDFSDTSKLFQ